MPTITQVSAPFWAGVEEGTLRIQRCDACGRRRFYPAEACPYCAAQGSHWVDLSGRGSVYSWTVVHRSVDSHWQALAPYAVAIVEIEEEAGVLLPGLLRGVSPPDIRAGMKVAASFAATQDGRAGFVWTPAEQTLGSAVIEPQISV